MLDTDVYAVAALAGGIDRMIDTALVRLVEVGQVRATRDGTLTAVAPRPRHEVEAALLDALSSSGSASAVRRLVRSDPRLGPVLVGLAQEGLLRPSDPSGRWPRFARVTPTGRRRLRELRDRPPASPWLAVALHGPERVADVDLRLAIFGSGRQRGGSWSGGTAPWWRRSSSTHAHGHGCGGHSCGGGGSSCGGGGGGCGGGSG